MRVAVAVSSPRELQQVLGILLLGVSPMPLAPMPLVALFGALALQPLQMEIDVASLEEEFQNKKDSKDKPLTHVYASKGL